MQSNALRSDAGDIAEPQTLDSGGDLGSRAGRSAGRGARGIGIGIGIAGSRPSEDVEFRADATGKVRRLPARAARPETLSFDDAQCRLPADAPFPTATEVVPVWKCAGSVLAQRVGAMLDLPHADSSAMDGYAIRYDDFAPGKILPVQERCFAGDLPSPLRPGHAIRLFTGAMMPVHADTVVMQEYVREVSGAIEIVAEPRHLRRGQHVRRRGEDVRAGQLLLPAGSLVRPAQIALMSAQGIDRVTVFSKLRVGILTTGDELVAPGGVRGPQQAYDSNGPMLAALVEGMGAVVTQVMHARDSERETRGAFEKMLPQCDLIVTAGGASVGERDLVRKTVELLGGTISVWQVQMKPGKPVASASISGKPVVCLPGNPAAAFTVFALLMTPMIRRMQGRTEILPPTPFLPLDTDKTGHAYRDEFLRVRSIAGQPIHPGVDGASAGGEIRLVPFEQQSPAALSSLAQASGLARVRPATSIARGERVQYYDFRHWLD
jgi:molybdopterin molybdotransferase